MTNRNADPEDANPYFDYKRFSADVYKYAERNGMREGRGGRNAPTMVSQIALVTGLGRQTVSFALKGYGISLRTACALADFADLNIDSYRL